MIVRATQRARPQSPRWHSVLLALVVIVLATTCSWRKEAETPVFIVSIDTLRSDHLPIYGYVRGRTPAIDAFRNESVLFERAFSHVPQTLPSHSTILTGLLPTNTGVRDNIGYVLPSSTATLASTLKQHGYATGAAVSSYVLRKSTGIASGFDFFDDHFDDDSTSRATSAERRGEESLAALENWLSGIGGKKVFGFLHLYEPHAPYAPPAEYATAATPYDGEISHADAIFGRFLAALKSRGLYDDAVIILLSDHGEGLGEHGEDEHGIFVYRASLQVPLLIKLPRGKRGGESISTPVGLFDVTPTVLARLGIAAQSDGIDVLQRRVPQRNIYGESYYPRLHLGWSELTSIVGDRLHFIAAPSSELYEYARDPAETRSVLAERRREAAALRSELQRSVRPLAPPSSVDPEDQRKLAALGYVGSTVGEGNDLPDPKAKIGSIRLFKRAVDAFGNGDDTSTQQILRQLIAENPTFVDAWGLLAQSERRRGNDAAAVEALRSAMTRFPQNSHVALALADALYATGRKEEARKHAELALHDDPVMAHEALATFALRDRDFATARREAESALREAPNRSNTLFLAAAADEGLEQWASAASDYEKALAALRARSERPPRGVEHRYGQALLRSGRVAEAEAAMQREVQYYADARDAWGELAAVVAAQGKAGAADAILRQALRFNPDPQMAHIVIETARVIGDQALAQQVAQQFGPR